MERVIAGIGSLHRGTEQQEFLGTCFSFVRPDVFVTAAHCVCEVSAHELFVNHHGGPDPTLMAPVTRIETCLHADIAVLVADAPGSKWSHPFGTASSAVGRGERVCSFGWPADETSKVLSARTLRFFRGYVHRPFTYHDPSSPGYSAYELSFACPRGLSGAPVFFENEPQTVVGVVTANFTSATGDDVVRYGVASMFANALDTLEAVLGGEVPQPRRW